MSRDDILKVQTLELNVIIRCEVCLKKVKRVLRKIDGVYQSSVDEALGKITVSGLMVMDPETVIEKLQKAGKPGVEVQLQNLQLGGDDDGREGPENPKDAVGVGQQQDQPKDTGGKGQQQQQTPLGSKDQGHEEQQLQPKGGVGGGGAAIGAGSGDTKMVAPWHQKPTPRHRQFSHDVNFEDDDHDDDPKMRPPNMIGGGGPLGGMPMGHPRGGAGMQQGGGGRGAAQGKPVSGLPMGLTHMGGTGMLPSGGGVGAAHGMPAGCLPRADCFPGGGGVMPIGAEMPPMSQSSLQQQHMAAIMQQQHMAAIMQQQQQQQQQLMMNGYSHYHAYPTHHHAHHGHRAHGGSHGCPPPPPLASSDGYGYGRPVIPQYPMASSYYYPMTLQSHPHDNMFSDENPNGCSVM